MEFIVQLQSVLCTSVSDDPASMSANDCGGQVKEMLSVAVVAYHDKEKHMQRRTFLLTSLLSALLPSTAAATEIDPKQTFVLQRDDITFAPWAGLPPGSGETAKLYGDIDRPGPYLVLMNGTRAGSARRTAMPPIVSRWSCRARGGSTVAPTSRRIWLCRCRQAVMSSEQRGPSIMTACLTASKSPW